MSKFINKAAVAAFLLMVFSGCEKGRTLPPVEEPEFSRYDTDVRMPSKKIGRDVRFSVLFPEGYDNKGTDRYPVVYMLHGYGEHGKDWSEWVSLIENLEKNGLQPMIYIFPNCENSYYCNYYSGKPLYMDMIVEELVPFVDKSYLTIADREHRAVMGYSMGGFGAMVLPLKNPDVFGISVPLSMSFRTDLQYMTEPQSGWDNQWGQIFGGRGQSGEDRLTDYYKAHCPFYQFIPENKAELSQVKWFFHCGDDEEQLLIANDNLHVQLRDNGYDHEFRIGDGGHSGSYWRTAARETLPWIAHVMNGGGKWTKSMKEVKDETSELNADGSFASEAYSELEEKSGLAIYLVHSGFSKEITDRIIGILSQKGKIFPYMILPCDLDVKPLSEWIAGYEEKYGVGKDVSKSHVIAFGDTGRDVYEMQDRFSRYYFIDADLAEDESTIKADAGKSYYIDQTDEGPNYRDMNALYNACKNAVSEDGSYTEADFEYRMRNGLEDKETEILLAAMSVAENIKYQ